MMNSKERVLAAFGRGSGLPDRVPVQFDLCQSLIDELSARHGLEPDYTLSYYEDLSYRISANELRVLMGSDCIVVGGEIAADFVPVRISEEVTTNEFGMHMKPTDLYVEVVKCPLEDAETVEDVEAYSFPDAYAPGRFEKAKRDIAKFGDTHFVIGDCELSLFEMAWHLTGMEKYLIDIMSEEDYVEALNDKVEEWTTGLALQLIEAGVDAIWFGEDLGTQVSMLISPDLWRESFRPRHERMIRKLREANPDIIIMMHSDGAVAPLLEDMIEIGIDVYNPVQPNVPGSDPEELKQTYGGRINFFGGIDQQQLLPSGDIEALEHEMRFRARVLGESGGYLMAPAHIVQADVAADTVEEMLRIAKSL